MENFNALMIDDTVTWIEALPTYQKNRINQLISQGKTLEEVSSIWLSVSPQDIAPFGAQRGERNIFVDKLKEELEGFLCGDVKYDSYRAEIKKEVSLTKSYAIGLISTAIAPVVGSSGTFIAPILAILLMGVGQMTINAWCCACKEKRE